MSRLDRFGRLSPRMGARDAAAVVGAAGSPRRDGRILLFGDSQMARDWQTLTTEFGNLNTGIINHANIFGRRRWEVVDNLGVSGNTTNDMIARLPAAVEAASECGVVLISASTNDIFIDTSTPAQVTSNLETIFKAFMDAGVYVIWKNETPRTFVDATKVAYQHAVNAWANEFERNNPGFSVFDAAAVVVDSTSTQFAAASNMLEDSVHYKNYGACLLGKAFNDKYASAFIPRSNLIVSASDTYAVSTASGQLFGNPLFSGSAGTKTAPSGGTAPTGTVADLIAIEHSVNTAATCTCSLVAQADGFGQAQRIVIANNGASDRFQYQNNASLISGISPGDLIEMECDIRVSSHTNLSAVALLLRGAVDGGSLINAYDGRNTTNDIALPSVFVGGTYRTRRLRLPAGSAVTSLQFRIEARFTTATGGGATIDVSRLSIRNLTRLGLEN